MSEGTDDNIEVRAQKEPRAAGWWDRPPPARRIAPPGYRYGRRWVLVNEIDVLKRGRYSKIFGYSVKSLARLVGVKPKSVHADVAAGLLDPHDLGSVIRWSIGKVRTGAKPDVETIPPLWRFFDGYSLIADFAPLRTSTILPLAVPMPTAPERKELVKLFWTHRVKLAGFVGSSQALAKRLLELDGIDIEDLPPRQDPSGPAPHRAIRTTATAMRHLAECGVLNHDKAAKTWTWAPFPKTLEAIADGLRSEGYEAVQVIERHIVIGDDMFSRSSASRLLAYMRTNRIKAPRCGRDRRLWIVAGMDRAMHSYKKRVIYRTPPRPMQPSDAPAGSGPRP